MARKCSAFGRREIPTTVSRTSTRTRSASDDTVTKYDRLLRYFAALSTRFDTIARVGRDRHRPDGLWPSSIVQHLPATFDLRTPRFNCFGDTVRMSTVCRSRCNLRVPIFARRASSTTEICVAFAANHPDGAGDARCVNPLLRTPAAAAIARADYAARGREWRENRPCVDWLQQPLRTRARVATATANKASTPTIRSSSLSNFARSCGSLSTTVPIASPCA